MAGRDGMETEIAMKNESKKLAVTRIIIFTILACSMSWGLKALYIFCIKDRAAHVAEGEALFALLVSMTPTAANILTRLLTKEGFGNLYLRVLGKEQQTQPDRKRHVRLCYIAAVLIPIAVGIVDVVIRFLYVRGSLKTGASVINAVSVLLFYLASQFPFFIGILGEEFGWSGYLFPKLDSVCKTIPSVMITGVVWALWHPFYLGEGLSAAEILSDFTGFLIFTVIYRAFLSLLTKKTGSCYPAFLAHAARGETITLLPAALFSVKTLTAVDAAGFFAQNVLFMLPWFLLAAVSLWIMRPRADDKRTQ